MERDVLGRSWSRASADAARARVPERGRGTRLPMRVRWSDVDAYGHVNNVKYFEYFQEARIRT